MRAAGGEGAITTRGRAHPASRTMATAIPASPKRRTMARGSASEPFESRSFRRIMTPRDDHRELVRGVDGGVARAEPLPALGILHALRVGRAEPRAGLGAHLPALPPDRLVPADLQRHPHPLRRRRGSQGLRPPLARRGSGLLRRPGGWDARPDELYRRIGDDLGYSREA